MSERKTKKDRRCECGQEFTDVTADELKTWVASPEHRKVCRRPVFVPRPPSAATLKIAAAVGAVAV